MCKREKQTLICSYSEQVSKGGPTRGDMLQEHVDAKCNGNKIALSTHWRGTLQGSVAGTCSRDQIAELAHLWKSCRDVFQGHVAVTHTLVCAGTFSLAQHEICAKFVPATCRTEFNLLNFTISSESEQRNSPRNVFNNFFAKFTTLKLKTFNLVFRSLKFAHYAVLVISSRKKRINRGLYIKTAV